jgi:hypothetical protein
MQLQPLPRELGPELQAAAGETAHSQSQCASARTRLHTLRCSCECDHVIRRTRQQLTAAHPGAGAGEAHAVVAATSDGLQALVRPVQVSDFWALAEVHCTSFYPRARWPFAPFLRLDRVVALQVRAHLLSSCSPR